jgi:hypothetical protein
MTRQSSEFSVDFSQNGNSRAFCSAGWSVPEPEERWAVGFESRMIIPAPAEPSAYFLVLKLRPFISPDRLGGQHLTVSVNGFKVGEFLVTEGTIRVCHLPWSIIQGRQDLQILFRTPDAASPAAFEAGEDGRMLAVAFRSLTLHRDHYPTADPRPTIGGSGVMMSTRSPTDNLERLAARELMLRFESLGQNCEFGLVQRRCDAEPLGLLRFASTPLPQLLAAFDGGFEGVGGPSTIEIIPSANNTEYMVSDTRYGLLYHAWVKLGEMASEDVHRRESRRMPILVRKLLQDLRASEKTFIFRGMRALPEEEVMPLAAALRRFGPNTLLFVTLADAAHPSGTVEQRMPGFLVGYIDRFAPSEDAHDLLFDDWLQICRNAHAIRVEAGG